jgi:hypothetical protein
MNPFIQIPVFAFHALWNARMMFDRENEPDGDRMYGPYYDTWPSGDDLIVNWPEEDQKLLAFPYEASRPDAATLLAVVEKYPEVFGSPPREAYSLKNLYRAASHVQARAFGPITTELGKLGGWHVETMIPAFDAINHEFEGKKHKTANTYRQWKNPNNKTICLGAGRPIKAGEEVYNYYGGEGTPIFLPRYGFIPDDDRNDFVTFPIFQNTLKVDPRIVGNFAEYHNGVNDPSRTTGSFMVKVRTNDLGQRLIPFMRMQAASGADFEENDRLAQRAFCRGKPDYTTCGISKQNEKQAQVLLKNLVEAMMNNGGQDLEGERELLTQLKEEANGTFSRPVVACEYRIRMKVTLQKAWDTYKNGGSTLDSLKKIGA